MIRLRPGIDLGVEVGWGCVRWEGAEIKWNMLSSIDNVSKLPQTADHQVHPGYPEGCVERGNKGITMMSSIAQFTSWALGFVKLQNSLTNDVVSVGLRASWTTQIKWKKIWSCLSITCQKLIKTYFS